MKLSRSDLELWNRRREPSWVKLIPQPVRSKYLKTADDVLIHACINARVSPPKTKPIELEWHNVIHWLVGNARRGTLAVEFLDTLANRTPIGSTETLRRNIALRILKRYNKAIQR